MYGYIIPSMLLSFMVGTSLCGVFKGPSISSPWLPDTQTQVGIHSVACIISQLLLRHALTLTTKYMCPKLYNTAANRYSVSSASPGSSHALRHQPRDFLREGERGENASKYNSNSEQ